MFACWKICHSNNYSFWIPLLDELSKRSNNLIKLCLRTTCSWLVLVGRRVASSPFRSQYISSFARDAAAIARVTGPRANYMVKSSAKSIATKPFDDYGDTEHSHKTSMMYDVGIGSASRQPLTTVSAESEDIGRHCKG